MGDVNFLQQGLTHCFACHRDYGGIEHLCEKNSIGEITSHRVNCQKCRDIFNGLIKKEHFSFCPHCGHKL